MGYFPNFILSKFVIDHTETTVFCMLILQAQNSLKMLIRSKSFHVESTGSSNVESCHLQVGIV